MGDPSLEGEGLEKKKEETEEWINFSLRRIKDQLQLGSREDKGGMPVRQTRQKLPRKQTLGSREKASTRT